MCRLSVQDSVNFELDAVQLKLLNSRTMASGSPTPAGSESSSGSPNISHTHSHLNRGFIDNLLDAMVLGEVEAVMHILQTSLGNAASHDSANNRLQHAVDSEGNTILHWCGDTHSEVYTQLFLDYGAYTCVNMVNAAGEAPLHVHAREGCLFGVTSLLTHGADPNPDPTAAPSLTPTGPSATGSFAADDPSVGHTCRSAAAPQPSPLQLATANGHSEVVGVLRAHGAL